jgi:hypothetical protein
LERGEPIEGFLRYLGKRRQSERFTKGFAQTFQQKDFSGSLTMTKQLKQGDYVEWESSGGTSRGVIKKIITEPTDFKGHHFEASKDKPEYLVESEKSGKEAIHKAEALKKIDKQ